MTAQAGQRDSSPWTHDIAVIGGGPAGSTAGALLARRGWRVLLLERERFPRFHIGESLLPSSNEIFDELGISAADLSRRFTEKRGASFKTEDGSLDCRAEFAAASEVSEPRTFQVLRSEFDRLLLDRAGALGADVRQGSRALDARFGEDGVDLSFRTDDGEVRAARVGCLVDASGRAGFLATRLDLRRKDPHLRKVAIFAHFRGVPRPEGDVAGDIRIVSRHDLGWVWLIPLREDITSVGVVVDHATYAARPQRSAEESFREYLQETPVVAAELASAAQEGPVRVEADFSYSSTAYSGDRWLLTGDAAAFLDPVFSSGVYLAMESGRDAATILDRGLRSKDLSRQALRRYERRVRRRYRRFRRFAAGFYRPEFRDVFFHPSGGFPFLSVVTGLAGNWQPGPRNWLGIASFFGLVRAQQWLPLVPRHRRPGSISNRPTTERLENG